MQIGADYKTLDYHYQDTLIKIALWDTAGKKLNICRYTYFDLVDRL